MTGKQPEHEINPETAPDPEEDDLSDLDGINTGPNPHSHSR